MIRTLLILIFTIISLDAVALPVGKVTVNCGKSVSCQELRASLNELLDQNYQIPELKKVLTPFLFNDGLEHFSYSATQVNGTIDLTVDASFYRLIDSIEILGVTGSDRNAILKVLPFRIGDYYQKSGISIAKESIESLLVRRGHSNVSIDVQVRNRVNHTGLKFSVRFSKALDIKEVKILTPNSELRKIISRRFNFMVGKPWDRIEFKKMQDQLEREYFDQGYFFSQFVSLQPEHHGSKVVLRVQVELGRRYHYSFSGATVFNHQEFSNSLKQVVKKQLGRFEERELVNAISKMYEEKGIFGTEIKLASRDGITKFNIPFTNLYFTIVEGKKISVEDIVFVGNDSFSSEELVDLYYDDPTVIAGREYLDQAYLNRYVTLVKKKYLQEGFVFVYVSEPKVRIKNNEASLEFEIREGQRCKLVDIQVKNVNARLEKGVVNSLVNKVGKYLNVLALPEDLTGSVKYVRNEGYYFSTINNINDKSILQYSEDFSEATLVLDFDVERKAILDTVVITGNSGTRSKVIKREVHLKRGDIITPQDVDLIWERLTGLGLFSKIEISPFVTNKDKDDDYYNVNLLIQVHEVDFGLIELSPGFRTDLGAKASAVFAYNNVSGMNRSFSAKLQANRKINSDGIESSRAEKYPGMFEGEGMISYLEPYLFKIPLEFTPAISGSRKRYYSFDADIGTVSFGLSKDFSKHFSSSIKYQFETINQYNATDEIDNGYFQIGGVTASVALDFTDKEIPARKGAWFGLSAEYATPELGSMNTSDLEVNFLKIISRNKFYIPYKKWVLASSFSFGMERNLASSTDFIPSIKVFRLSGVDLVRGYDDSEINKIESGEEISEITINDRAFFTNIKVEPRYYMSDNTIFGLFLDAGNVTVNEFDFTTLRYSTGVTFKFLTPVGTIDFDYGVKLGRKKEEGFGKFHLSIGFF